MALTRRRFALAPLAAAGAALSGCAVTGNPWPGAERIVDLRRGREVTPAELLDEVRASDLVLLGELHDNPLHHRRRAGLVAALAGNRAAVVAEQLHQGRTVAAGSAPLLQRLGEAGFDPAAWGWPLHQALFEAVDRAALPLAGGNLPPALARRIAREGASALPPDLAALLAAAPLSDAARAALDDALQQGHCGRLPAASLPAMRLAQRARDAAMWRALQSGGGRPALLLAGNGHVRLDFGVPQLAAALAPGRSLLAVGLAEEGQPVEGPYTHLWLTAPAQRGDPCAGLPDVLGPPRASHWSAARPGAAPAVPALRF